jgi:hypothetical protein
MKVKGKITPLRDNVFVTDMDFGMQQTSAGIYVASDDGKSSGIHPRWGKVWAIGPDQKDLSINDWILIEHGRWTRGIDYETDTGEVITIRMVENKSILISSDEKPNDVYRSVAIGAGSNVNFNIPGA